MSRLCSELDHGADDHLGIMGNGVDRRFYRHGKHRGMARRSREERRVSRLCSELDHGADDMKTGDTLLEEVCDIECEDVCFELGHGYREAREGSTLYPVEENVAVCGRRVKLTKEERCNGTRWFCEKYPPGWMSSLSLRERKAKSSRCLEDYGKEFVEYDGRWYVARRLAEQQL